MSLLDVLVGGGIGVAGTLAAGVMAARNQRRSIALAAAGQLGTVAVSVTIVARSAVDGVRSGKRKDHDFAMEIVARLKEQSSILLEAYERLLATGTPRMIVAGRELSEAMEALFVGGGASEWTDVGLVNAAIDRIHEARLALLAPVRPWNSRRRRALAAALNRPPKPST